MTAPTSYLTTWRAWYENAAEAVLVADNGRRIVDTNAAAVALLGRPGDATPGLRLDDLFPPADRVRVPLLWEAMLRDGTIETETKLLTTHDAPVPAGLRLRANFVPGFHLVTVRPTVADRRPGAGERPLVLVADDEDTVRGLVRVVLEQDGYEVIDAETGGRAVELTAGRVAAVDVLLTDVRMPGMTGPELARHLRAARPDLPVVFMSGYVGDAACGYDPDLARSEFLSKPFQLDALRSAVRRALRPTVAV